MSFFLFLFFIFSSYITLFPHLNCLVLSSISFFLFSSSSFANIKHYFQLYFFLQCFVIIFYFISFYLSFSFSSFDSRSFFQSLFHDLLFIRFLIAQASLYFSFHSLSNIFFHVFIYFLQSHLNHFSSASCISHNKSLFSFNLTSFVFLCYFLPFIRKVTKYKYLSLFNSISLLIQSLVDSLTFSFIIFYLLTVPFKNSTPIIYSF